MRQKQIDEFTSKRIKEILNVYQTNKDWDKTIEEEIYIDESPEAQPLIDAIEFIHQTKIKDAKHLQKITGISSQSLEWLERVVLNAKQSRYMNALRTALENGAKYKELLKIDPKEFSLPENWGSFYDRTANKESSILKAIADEFLLLESRVIHPDLRDIAEELEAPYSIIMEAKNMVDYRKD